MAVAEAGSLKQAAEEKLHTTQPSLSRQMRDLEAEVGAPLLVRGSRGVKLTAAGRALLDHARTVLAGAENAVEAARQAAAPARPSFSLGFMIGHDSTWVPESLRLLREELPRIHVVISTQNSPQLAVALSQGLMDAAILRREDGTPDLDYLHLIDEPLQVFLHREHPLAARETIDVRELAAETFLSVSGAALSLSGRPPALRRVTDRYLRDKGLEIRPSHEVDSLGAVMSLIESTRGVALLPAYATTFLPGAVTIRPLQGTVPTIELSVGYQRRNGSPILKVFLERMKRTTEAGNMNA